MTPCKKKTSEVIEWLGGRIAMNQSEALIVVSSLARSERQLRKAAKAVIKAANGSSETAFEEAVDQLRKALK